MNAAPLLALDAGAASGEYGYVDRLLVVRNGYLVFDRRYENDYEQITQGRDLIPHQYNYSHPDWHPYYRGTELHTLQSITKSVTSALIGIAIERGELTGVELEVVPFFAGYEIPDPDGRKARIRLVDLLTMRSGIEWHETDRPMDSSNTTIQLEASEDWIRFVWDQPMQYDPGQTWVYNSGGSHLLSGILRAATGSHAHEYAQRQLFGPLGIDQYHWKLTPEGFADTEGGLYLRSEDLAKLGYLYLRGGVWDGARILPPGWTDASTDRLVEDIAPGNPSNDRGYGYQWWRLDRGSTAVWAGLGYGGQYLLVIPAHDLIGVINSWNIFGGARSPLGPFLDALLASVGERRPGPAVVAGQAGGRRRR